MPTDSGSLTCLGYITLPSTISGITPLALNSNSSNCFSIIFFCASKISAPPGIFSAIPSTLCIDMLCVASPGVN